MNATNGLHIDDRVQEFMIFPYRLRVKVFEMLRPEEREAMFAKLRQLRALPREQWEEFEALPLEPPLQEMYLVPFTDELLVYFTPLPDGNWRVEDVTSQEALDLFFATWSGKNGR